MTWDKPQLDRLRPWDEELVQTTRWYTRRTPMHKLLLRIMSRRVPISNWMLAGNTWERKFDGTRQYFEISLTWRKPPMVMSPFYNMAHKRMSILELIGLAWFLITAKRDYDKEKVKEGDDGS